MRGKRVAKRSWVWSSGVLGRQQHEWWVCWCIQVPRGMLVVVSVVSGQRIGQRREGVKSAGSLQHGRAAARGAARQGAATASSCRATHRPPPNTEQ